MNIRPLNFLLLTVNAAVFFIYFEWFAIPLLEIIRIDGILLNIVLAPLFLGFLSYSMYQGEAIWRVLFGAITPILPLLLAYESDPAKPGLSMLVAVGIWIFFVVGGGVALLTQKIARKRSVE